MSVDLGSLEILKLSYLIEYGSTHTYKSVYEGVLATISPGSTWSQKSYVDRRMLKMPRIRSVS